MAGQSFTFRFQKILEVKEQQEKALQIELARVDEAIAARRRTLQRWADERRELLDQMARCRAAGDVEESRRCAQYLQHVRNRIASARQALEDLHERRNEVRQELEEVLKSCKMLENYRERLRKEFVTEREKAEEKTLELHAARRFIQAEGTG